MAFDPEDPVGSTLGGRYRIERLIGQGGFASVYLAQDDKPQIQRRIALKVLARELAAEESFRERFFRESSAVVQLDDYPGIVTVYDAGEDDGWLYIVMRYIEGIDLGQLIEQQGIVVPDLLLPIFSQVAAALDGAHDNGMVHRDVKPGNILLSKDLTRAYLADFGLTKRLDGDSALTQARQYLGTPFYSSPEQIESKPIGPTSDVYSLGAVLYHCLTGYPPFEGTPESVIAKHFTAPVPSVRERRPELPGLIDGVIARAMAKTPEERYATAGDLATDVGRSLTPAGETFAPGAFVPPTGAADGSPSWVPAGAPPPPPSSWPPGQAPTPPPSSWPPGQAPPPTAPASWPPTGQPGRSGRRLTPWLIGAGLGLVLAVIGLVVVAMMGDSGPAAFPNEEETALLDALPASFEQDCRRDEAFAEEPEVRAALDCTFTDQPADVGTFLLYATAPELRDGFDARIEGTPATDDGRDCASADDVTHEYDDEDGSAGRVACYRYLDDGEQAVHVWTDDRALVLASAAGDSTTFELYEWWAELTDRAPVPLTRAEDVLLLRVPEEHRGSCRPAAVRAGDEFAGELASLTCFPAEGEGVDVATYTQFGTIDEMTAVFATIREEQSVPMASGQECPNDDRYSVGDPPTPGGRLMCYFADDGRVRFVWTNETLRILTRATGIDDQFDPVLTWWKDAGPLP